MSTNNLPALPVVGAAVSADDVQRWESQVMVAVATVEDMDRLEEWRSQAAALETYLRGKEMQNPMMGAQRRIEARIGQLLGPAPKRGGKEMNQRAGSFHSDVRREFRLMAKAFNGECNVSDDEWRTSRRALVKLIRDRATKPERPAPVGKPTTRNGPRISVPDGRTTEALCRMAMEMESQGASTITAAAAIGVSQQIYRKMRDIVVLSDVAYLTTWDRIVVDVALDNLNETQQVTPNREAVNKIVEHLWGRRARGALSYDGVARRRVEGFENACRAVNSACAITSRIDIPYLKNHQLEAADDAFDRAVKDIRGFQLRIRNLHRVKPEK